ncbi:hypothetical protein PTSG_09233 [Salpingoeca rosetta]|uniref:Uncharacterized protein n=1 Tax=Salpingoeca rosetta (strain ATCC 50818 / BSB-021) TaxID=946362 RepID=F2UN42_SALR5|nr:uncharacterized protein PTSG_09233 [Salpingoeca rosetta]EGD78541.1 hypothetical protein PTSG_09233 [Salpingoeca rosetta]|eukprot:XP_004989490.1 hypothetical protein PTSG_09233 [Salpingoeca rosetta]
MLTLTQMLLFTDISSANTVGLTATADDSANGRLTQRRCKRRASSWHCPASFCPAHGEHRCACHGAHRERQLAQLTPKLQHRRASISQETATINNRETPWMRREMELQVQQDRIEQDAAHLLHRQQQHWYWQQQQHHWQQQQHHWQQQWQQQQQQRHWQQAIVWAQQKVVRHLPERGLIWAPSSPSFFTNIFHQFSIQQGGLITASSHLRSRAQTKKKAMDKSTTRTSATGVPDEATARLRAITVEAIQTPSPPTPPRPVGGSEPADAVPAAQLHFRRLNAARQPQGEIRTTTMMEAIVEAMMGGNQTSSVPDVTATASNNSSITDSGIGSYSSISNDSGSTDIVNDSDAATDTSTQEEQQPRFHVLGDEEEQRISHALANQHQQQYDGHHFRHHRNRRRHRHRHHPRTRPSFASMHPVMAQALSGMREMWSPWHQHQQEEDTRDNVDGGYEADEEDEDVSDDSDDDEEEEEQQQQQGTKEQE